MNDGVDRASLALQELLTLAPQAVSDASESATVLRELVGRVSNGVTAARGYAQWWLEKHLKDGTDAAICREFWSIINDAQKTNMVNAWCALYSVAPELLDTDFRAIDRPQFNTVKNCLPAAFTTANQFASYTLDWFANTFGWVGDPASLSIERARDSHILKIDIDVAQQHTRAQCQAVSDTQWKIELPDKSDYPIVVSLLHELGHAALLAEHSNNPLSKADYLNNYIHEMVAFVFEYIATEEAWWNSIGVSTSKQDMEKLRIYQSNIQCDRYREVAQFLRSDSSLSAEEVTYGVAYVLAQVAWRTQFGTARYPRLLTIAKNAVRVGTSVGYSGIRQLAESAEGP